ncbi:MAG: ribosome silencing factor [Micavibrio sp.]|nr:ribosome silencing factor [Micavibrio sp.]
MHTLTHDGPIGSEDLKTLIEQSLDADKAENIVTININEQTGLADYMIVASGTSSRHVNALAEKLRDRLNIRGIKDIKIEGLNQCDWVAMDCGDIIVHLFRPEVREFYNIEKMWCTYQQFDVVNGDGHMSAS